MDRSARLVSIGVAAVGVVIVLYLSWNPRGLPRSRLSNGPPPNPSDSNTSASVHGDAYAEVAPSQTDSTAESDELSFNEHMARLQEGGLELTRTDFVGSEDQTLFEVLSRLRPYWLSDTLDASVRVGGQLIGKVDSLRDVPARSAEMVRLEFYATEPHWIVRVFTGEI